MNRLIHSVSGVAMALMLIGSATAEEKSAQQDKSAMPLSKIWESKATGAPEAIVYDAAAAMEFFRTLSGDWVTDSPSEGLTGSNATEHVESFHTIARGSVVRQTMLPGTPFEMEVLYHMDGPDTLLLTHYCAAKNVPLLKFRKTGKPGEIQFDFAGGTNLNAKLDSYAHSATFKVIDKDTFVMDSTGHVKGELKPTHATYKRKPTGT